MTNGCLEMQLVDEKGQVWKKNLWQIFQNLSKSREKTKNIQKKLKNSTWSSCQKRVEKTLHVEYTHCGF